jgi:hypothetical protein
MSGRRLTGVDALESLVVTTGSCSGDLAIKPLTPIVSRSTYHEHVTTRVLWGAAIGIALLLLSACTSHIDRPPPRPPSNASDPTTAAVPSRSRTAQPLAPPELRKYCHSGDPLAAVYRPARLEVKNYCAAVTGVVGDHNIEHDGDLHISLTQVGRQWLNAVNLQRPKQDLVLEAVPGLPVPTPAVGARITVIGPWVLDTETGWLEIHPVWTILSAG